MEKIWLNSYDPGVPYEINLGLYSSMVEMAEEGFKLYGPLTCYANYGVKLTYQGLDDLSKAFAGFLQSKTELKKGDRVAIMLPNILQYPVSMLGSLRAGMIVVNVNPFYTSRELQLILKDSGAKAIVILENFAHTLEKILPETEIKTVIVTKIGDLLGFFKGGLYNFSYKKVKKIVPSWNIPSAFSFKKVIHPRNQSAFQKIVMNPDDIAYLQYTGGTTGGIKGVMLTHQNMVSNLVQLSVWADAFFKKKPIGGVINALPLYHIFASTANCLVFLRPGFSNILITNPRDILEFVAELERQPFAVILGVNTLFSKLLKNEEFCRLDLSTLQFSLGGGMSIQRSVAEKWQRVTGVPLLEGYGLTEASPTVTLTPLSMKKFTGNIGLPLPSTEVKICDENGNEVPVGQSGELYVRGPQIAKGYWNRSDLTKESFTEDGWLKTADIVSIDHDGYLHFIDRKNDVITVSGFNVYPNEVEEILMNMKGIAEAAVIGVETEEQGESLKAFVVKEDPAISVENIIQHCRQYLTGYKIPHWIEFRDELPKSAIGKILHRELREAERKPKEHD